MFNLLNMLFGEDETREEGAFNTLLVILIVIFIFLIGQWVMGNTPVMDFLEIVYRLGTETFNLKMTLLQVVLDFLGVDIGK